MIRAASRPAAGGAFTPPEDLFQPGPGSPASKSAWPRTGRRPRISARRARPPRGRLRAPARWPLLPGRSGLEPRPGCPLPGPRGRLGWGGGRRLVGRDQRERTGPGLGALPRRPFWARSTSPPTAPPSTRSSPSPATAMRSRPGCCRSRESCSRRVASTARPRAARPLGPGQRRRRRSRSRSRQPRSTSGRPGRLVRLRRRRNGERQLGPHAYSAPAPTWSRPPSPTRPGPRSRARATVVVRPRGSFSVGKLILNKKKGTGKAAGDRRRPGHGLGARQGRQVCPQALPGGRGRQAPDQGRGRFAEEAEEEGQAQSRAAR